MTTFIQIQTMSGAAKSLASRACLCDRTSRRVKMIAVWCLLAAFAVTMPVLAQTTGKISGVVTDAENGETLIGANIVIVGTSMGASTDIDGSFFIINVPPGSYDVQASIVGYQKVIQRSVIVNVGRTTTANFSLKSTAVMQKDVVIEAVRPDVEKEKTSTSAITRPDEVKQLAGMHNVGDVLSLSADVSDGHFRGGRSGEVLYTLQGMGTMNPLDNSTAVNPIMSAIEEVEVVTSGFGAQYGNAQSGVVNVSMKEGKTDKWRSFAEARMSVPQKKHFGASPWDVSANPYLQELYNANNYNLTTSDGAMPAYFGLQQVVNGYTRLMLDTAELAQVSYALAKQLFNNVNRSYGNKPDYSLEFSTGGPLGESMRMFIAMNTSVSWPVLATEHPDENNQVMGNIVVDAGRGGTFRMSGAYTQNNENTFNTSGNNYLQYLYNMLTGTTYRKRTNEQLGLRFTKAIDQNTFYEIKLNALMTRNQVGSRNCVPDSLVNVGQNIYWFARPSTLSQTSAGQYLLQPASTFNDDKTQTVSLDASFTSQVAKAHLVNAGIQANMYFIDVNDRSGGLYVNLYTANTDYYAKPVEASMYVQDKMEFEGMIANLGLRLDGWSMRGTTYADFATTYNKDKEAPIIGRLQPRAGFSFPVSVNTVFHVNYGAYIQRPSFQFMVRETRSATSVTFSPNPALKPQSTNSYDLGISQALGEGFTIDASGYYKNVNDLVRQVTFVSSKQNYSTYINYDYADIRGAHVSVTKRRGNLTGSVNYTYSVNTGSSASPTTTVLSQSILVNHKVTGTVLTPKDNTTSMPTQEVVLDYDRTHNLVLNLGYVTDEDFGFQVGESHPLGDVSIALNSTASSGRPYTYKPLSQAGEWMNMRSPAEYNTDFKISKRIKNFYGTTLTVYAEVFNVFNNKIWNYNYVFQASQTSDNNIVIEKYLENSDNYGAADGLLYYQSNNYTNGFGTDQSFVLYSNQPRSYWFGVSVEF
jgi:outer membrane receptor protein involved in Fe transport